MFILTLTQSNGDVTQSYLIFVVFLQQTPDIISGNGGGADGMIPHVVDPLLHDLQFHTKQFTCLGCSPSSRNAAPWCLGTAVPLYSANWIPNGFLQTGLLMRASRDAAFCWASWGNGNAAINPTDVTEVTKNNTLEKRDFAPVSFKNLREVRRNC